LYDGISVVWDTYYDKLRNPNYIKLVLPNLLIRYSKMKPGRWLTVLIEALSSIINAAGTYIQPYAKDLIEVILNNLTFYLK